MVRTADVKLSGPDRYWRIPDGTINNVDVKSRPLDGAAHQRSTLTWPDNLCEIPVQSERASSFQL